MITLTDSHCHASFLPAHTWAEFAQILAAKNTRAVAQTILPSEFLTLERCFLPKNLVPSLGFHPWYISSCYEEELALFSAALARTRLIGEIGLDFSPQRTATVCPDLQQRVLRSLLRLVCEAAQSSTCISDGVGSACVGSLTMSEDNSLPHTHSTTPYVLSIHAVHAVTPTLDLLQDVGAVPSNGILPIIHRFNGRSDELTRLMKIGGYISVHPTMLRTKRGRAYVCQVPKERILMETDFPSNPSEVILEETFIGEGDTPAHTFSNTRAEADAYATHLVKLLTDTLSALSALRGENMAHIIARTCEILYGPTI